MDDWLKPHIARIDQFCASLKDSNTTIVHIPNQLKVAKCKYGKGECMTDPADTAHTYQKQLSTKIQPVSVIVSDKARSSLSGSTSPTSSLSDSGIQESSDSNNNNNNSGNDSDTCSPNKKQKNDYNYKPLPMVRKSRRRFICAEQKDDCYWERRRRNNEAAKKSREQRREKEIEVNRKCSDLEKENSGLKFTVMNLHERNTQMQNTIHMYKELLIKNNLI